MKIKNIHIKNFKSIVDVKIIDPNNFTVFVGPNGAGKSNIFEALEYRLFSYKFGDLYKEMDSLFPYSYSFNAKNNGLTDNKNEPQIEIALETFTIWPIAPLRDSSSKKTEDNPNDCKYKLEYKQCVDNHSEIFIANNKREKVPLRGDNKLSTSCSNLEKVLKRLLLDESKREEIVEWLQLLIPGFHNIDILSSDLSGSDTLIIFEKTADDEIALTKDLISDGTYNILALLTAVYQSDEPQFLCIEEPENGLNPYVIRKLVDFFRAACENGHYIWLNTHSQTLVECLTPEEVILVDKINGETVVQQVKGTNLYGLDMAEAWLSGALGGGTPW